MLSTDRCWDRVPAMSFFCCPEKVGDFLQNIKDFGYFAIFRSRATIRDFVEIVVFFKTLNVLAILIFFDPEQLSRIGRCESAVRINSRRKKNSTTDAHYELRHQIVSWLRHHVLNRSMLGSSPSDVIFLLSRKSWRFLIFLHSPPPSPPHSPLQPSITDHDDDTVVIQISPSTLHHRPRR